MNWRTIAVVLYLVGMLNTVAGTYLFAGEFSFGTVVFSMIWPVYPIIVLLNGALL